MTEPGLAFTSIDPDADYFHLLRRELGVTSFGINQLILQPRQRLRVHRHERQEEVYLVLEGELTLIVEGETHVLGVGDLARVGPELKRQLTNPGGVKTIVLALGGDGEHQSRDGIAWSGWDDKGEGRPPKDVPLPDDLP
jgi:uncharacterized cupin superfamily protein